MSVLVNVVNKCYNYNLFWQLCNLIVIHSEHLFKTMMCIEDAAVPISSAKLTRIIRIIVPVTMGTSDLFKAKYGIYSVCVCACVHVPTFCTMVWQKWQCGIGFCINVPIILKWKNSWIFFLQYVIYLLLTFRDRPPLLTWNWCLPASTAGYWRPFGH